MVRLDGGSGEAPASVRVTGLSNEELAGLRATVWRAEGWHALMTVTASGGDGTPIAGRYVASREALEFHPRVPFHPGRSYLVRFDPARLPAPRPGPVVEAAVALPSQPPTSPTVVASLSPSSDVWPSNVLRFYVHFSAPMSRTQGLEFVRLVDDAGQDVEGALAPSAIDFWNADRTRYTVFLSPGRMGRPHALHPGREYTVVVNPAWPDAEGRPLDERYRRTFRAGPPLERPIALSDWRLDAPRAGTIAPLVVAFPHPLDEGLLHRALGVAPSGRGPLDGVVAVTRGEMEWRFTPADAWRAGVHELLVLSILEDSAGNRLGRAFKLDAHDRQDEPPPPEQFTLSFIVK